jgi:DNA-binding CsgD family transcriptional regulator
VTLDHTDTGVVLDAATLLTADPVPSITDVLELLRTMIPCVSASFNDMAMAAGDFRYAIVPPDDELLAERLKPKFDQFAHQHPLIVHAQSQPLCGAIRFSDVPGGELLTETDLYREFFEPFGLRYQLAIQLPAPTNVVVGYALNRIADQGEFSDRDVQVLNALGPHLAMHHRVAIDLQRAHAMSAEADLGGWAVITVRADGVIEASSTSRSPSLAAGQRVPTDVAALLPSYGDLGPPAGAHEVKVGAERWRCVVNPVPVGPTVLLMRPLYDEPPEAMDLVDAGLTPRQIQVALELARSGGTNSQLARTLDISEATVKKHLESVFRALAVDSRAAAAVALRELTQ